MAHINIGQKYSNLCKGVVYTKLNSVSAFTSVSLNSSELCKSTKYIWNCNVGWKTFTVSIQIWLKPTICFDKILQVSVVKKRHLLCPCRFAEMGVPPRHKKCWEKCLSSTFFRLVWKDASQLLQR